MTTQPGSPPRVRGTVHIVSPSPIWMGITPACAGNRPPCRRRYRWGRDHPRVCGEQLACALRARAVKGSPPRVRGTDQPCVCHRGGPRITPACAGNSYFFTAAYALLKDHPRVCGEQEEGKSMKNIMEGSPPRVRGTGVSRHLGHDTARITPACAGNSSLLCPFSEQSWDHPRVCGEQAYP